MDNGLANMPLPLAIVLTAAGAGGGGFGAWSMLAARAVSNPTVQLAVAEAAQTAGHAINSGVQIATSQHCTWSIKAALHALAGAALASAFITALLGACACGGRC